MAKPDPTAPCLASQDRHAKKERTFTVLFCVDLTPLALPIPRGDLVFQSRAGRRRKSVQEDLMEAMGTGEQTAISSLIVAHPRVLYESNGFGDVPIMAGGWSGI
jgi:hypothetical protein